MEAIAPVIRYQFVLWWAITVITLVYYHVVEWRLFWANLKIPLYRTRRATFPLPGRRVDYLNFAFTAGFVGVTSLWFGMLDFVGAQMGWRWLVPALLVGKGLQWSMKMTLRWYEFEDEKPQLSTLGAGNDVF